MDNVKINQSKPALPYHSLNTFLQETFGGKVYKLSLSSGCTCPNRDGSISTGGCMFCSEGGAGEFAASAVLPVHEQIARAKRLVDAKRSKHFAGYIAYFQSFTNTYGPIRHLRTIFTEAIEEPEIVALSVATRPDCLPDETVALLKELNRRKPVFVELGLQTMHEDSAAFFGRGYALAVFEDAVHRLHAAELNVVVHVIVGLPGEDAARTKETVRYLAAMGIDGIKLHLLHVMRGTRLAALYGFEQKTCSGTDSTGEPDESLRHAAAESLPQPDDTNMPGQSAVRSANTLPPLPFYTLEAYADLVIDLVELLPPEVVIHRMTGDAPKRLLLSPMWSADKKRVLNTIMRRFRERGAYQGRLYRGSAQNAASER